VKAGQLLEALERELADPVGMARVRWICQDCLAIDCFEEGEQGQPHHCCSCGSPRIKYHPATFQSSLP